MYPSIVTGVTGVSSGCTACCRPQRGRASHPKPTMSTRTEIFASLTSGTGTCHSLTAINNTPPPPLPRALASGRCVLQRSDIQLLPPISAPEKVVCVGMNYRDHCLEQNVAIPEEPIIFSKFPSAITGPYDDIVMPAESQVRAAGGVGLVPDKPIPKDN